MRFVWNAQLLPQIQKGDLISGVVLPIWFVDETVIMSTASRGIINIATQVPNPLNLLRNSHDKCVEGYEDTTGTTSAKNITTVDVIVIVNPGNLFCLPARMHGEDSVSLSYV